MEAWRWLVVVFLPGFLVAGCLSGNADRDNPGDRTDGSMMIPRIPMEHSILVNVTLPANGWAIWLWENHGPSSNGSLPLFSSVSLKPLASVSEGFVAGYFPIQASRGPSGNVSYMSETEITRVAHVQAGGNQRIHAYEVGIPRRAIHWQGFLVFSQEAAEFEVRQEQKGDSDRSVLRLDPIARGANLSVDYQAFDFATFLGAMSEESQTVHSSVDAGFVAAAVLRDSAADQSAGLGVRVSVTYPDGKLRERTATASVGVSNHAECAAAQNPCRSDYWHPTLDDLGVGCQPAGRATATTSWNGSDSSVYWPVLISVPFDYCSLIGASASTPHPCAAMERPPFEGCPH